MHLPPFKHPQTLLFSTPAISYGEPCGFDKSWYVSSTLLKLQNLWVCFLSAARPTSMWLISWTLYWRVASTAEVFIGCSLAFGRWFIDHWMVRGEHFTKHHLTRSKFTWRQSKMSRLHFRSKLSRIVERIYLFLLGYRTLTFRLNLRCFGLCHLTVEIAQSSLSSWPLGFRYVHIALRHTKVSVK